MSNSVEIPRSVFFTITVISHTFCVNEEVKNTVLKNSWPQPITRLADEKMRKGLKRNFIKGSPVYPVYYSGLFSFTQSK
jgi:hypothetical protein